MAPKRITSSERVAHWLDLAGWSLSEASKRTTINRQKLWRIVNGQQPLKDTDVELLTAALGIEVPQFWGVIEGEQGQGVA